MPAQNCLVQYFRSRTPLSRRERKIMSKPLIYALLLTILMVTVPHAVHLPLWVTALCVALLLWRAYLTHSGGPLPNRWLLAMITSTCASAITISYNTLFGKEAGIALL